jgi:hypothetical protein
VHYFFSARINQGLRSHKTLLATKTNTHNQPQQANARSTQKVVLWQESAGVAGYFSGKYR